MDFVKILRSVEELLYEAISWLLFYPLTLWRCIRHPGRLSTYTASELGDRPDEQFTENISPPLFLMLSVLLAHAFELSVGVRVESLPIQTAGSKLILSSDTNLLGFRSFVFALFPLVMAVGMLRRRLVPINRDSLRAPFYLQCYVAAPFCLFLSLGSILARLPGSIATAIGALLIVLATGWYIWAETRMFSHELQMPVSRAGLTVLWLFLLATLVAFLVALLALLA